LLIPPAQAVEFVEEIEQILHRQPPGLGQPSRLPHIDGIRSGSSLHTLMLAAFSWYSCAAYETMRYGFKAFL
jgi:hypothetical protein